MFNVIRTILAIAILSCGLCFTGCSADTNEHETTKAVEVKEEKQQVKQVQQPKQEPESCLYYVNAEVFFTEDFPEGTTVCCEDANGNRYSFTGNGYYVGDKVKLIMNNHGTDNFLDDSVENAKVV